MGEARKVAGMAYDQSQSKKDVFREAQREKNKVHFAPLLDISHLKNADLDPKYQRYKGEVVFDH